MVLRNGSHFFHLKSFTFVTSHCQHSAAHLFLSCTVISAPSVYKNLL